MKKKSSRQKRLSWLVLTFIFLNRALTVAHEVAVHKAITLHAEASAQQFSANYRGFLEAIKSPDGSLVFQIDAQLPAKNPIGWLIEGSAKEDDVRTDEGGIRSYNHFYNPLSGEGLSNFPHDDRIPPPGMGRASVEWASQLNAPGINFASSQTPEATWNVNTENRWSWQNARQFQLIGLFDSDPFIRGRNLARMFRSLGQVIHLLQDASSPQHVRDEQHYDGKIVIINSPWRSPMEKYGGVNIDKLDYTHGMLDWRSAGFEKMKDFWDRDFYTWNGNRNYDLWVQPLIDDQDPTKPGSKLGLAEFVNGNFIGDRHSYREIKGDPYHFPFPSLDEGTDFAQLRQTPGRGKPTPLGGGNTGLRYIVAKTGQGRRVTYHGAVNYLIAANKEIEAFTEPMVFGATIDDPDVLKNYHDILIPEAVRYSAGLLDYFFRGRMQVVSAVWNGSQYTITVRNQSGQELVNGGKFFVLKDEANGNRSFVTSQDGVALTQNVADGSTWQFNFPGPQVTAPTKFVVVYMGTIGLSGTAPSDPVDVNKAIAAQTFTISPPAWGCPNWATQLTWDTAIESVNGSATCVVTPDGGVSDSFSCKLEVFSDGAALGQNTGTITHNGPICNAQLRLTMVANSAPGFFTTAYVTVDSSLFSQQLLLKIFDDKSPGLYLYNFTLPDTGGLDDTITITFVGSHPDFNTATLEFSGQIVNLQ